MELLLSALSLGPYKGEKNRDIEKESLFVTTKALLLLLFCRRGIFLSFSAASGYHSGRTDASFFTKLFRTCFLLEMNVLLPFQTAILHFRAQKNA